MKLAFCSEFNDEDINWVHISQIPSLKAIQMHLRPTKAVLGIILLLEQGKFPIIKINSISEYPLKDSTVVHEAYMRCHMSVVPIVHIEEEIKDTHANIDDPPYEQEEPDRGGPARNAER